MNTKQKITAIASAALMISCGDASGDLVNLDPVQVPTAVTKMLKKVTATNTATGQVNTDIYNYTSGKLTTVVDGESSMNYKLDYNNAQISKITATTMTAQPWASSTLTHTGAQLTAITGTISPDITFQSTLSYTAGKLTSFVTNYYMVGVPAVERKKTINLEYSGENVSKAIIEDQYFNVPSTTSKTVIFSNFDANPNPYRTLPTEFTIVKGLLTQKDDAFAGLSVNNYKTITVQAAGVTNTENITLTYDQQTYPNQAVSPSVSKNFEYLP